MRRPRIAGPELPAGTADYLRVHRQAFPDAVTGHTTACEYPCDDLASLGFRLRELAVLIDTVGRTEAPDEAWGAVSFLAHHLGDHALAAHFRTEQAG